jgi:molecular chaperone GrpE
MEKQGESMKKDQEFEEIIEEEVKQSPNSENEIDDSEAVIDNLNEQIAVLQDKLLRQMAESENIRSRCVKLTEEAREYANFGFSKDLVPIIDHLSKALEHMPKNLDAEMQNVVDGIKMTKAEFKSVFKKHSLESIEPHPGDKFDYHNHHAISQIVTDEYKEGTIIDTMQIGYKIKNRLIRPAAVIVAKNN